MSTNANTAVLWMPQGSGKSTHAQAVAALLGCTHVVDEWSPGAAMQAGALHLSNAALPEHYTPTLSPDALSSLKQAIAASPFVTVGEIAEACAMTAATVTAAAESMLRTALEAEGCERAKRKASDGVVRWGYITPYFKSLTQPAGESTLPEHLEEPHTPEEAHCACRACNLNACPFACPTSPPQPTARPAPTGLGQSVLAPCSSSLDGDRISVLTGGAA